jgi:hypothetical protein
MKTFGAKFAAVAVVAAIGLPGVASASRGGGQPQETGRCTGRPFELVKISDLANAEKARADKVDRNGNDFVCRMDIPGHGGGNTGNNSNIKDDKI